jgi:hypothetical protein
MGYAGKKLAFQVFNDPYVFGDVHSLETHLAVTSKKIPPETRVIPIIALKRRPVPISRIIDEGFVYAADEGMPNLIGIKIQPIDFYL